MAGKAGRGRVLADDPVGRIAAAEAFEALATRLRVLLSILVHDAYHLALALRDRIVGADGFEQVEDDHGAVREEPFAVAFECLVVGIDVWIPPNAE